MFIINLFLHQSSPLNFDLFLCHSASTYFCAAQLQLISVPLNLFLQTHPVDLDASKLVFTEAQRVSFNKYVTSTRIRAARNISGFSLPAGTSTRLHFLSLRMEILSHLFPPLRAEYFFFSFSSFFSALILINFVPFTSSPCYCCVCFYSHHYYNLPFLDFMSSYTYERCQCSRQSWLRESSHSGL